MAGRGETGRTRREALAQSGMLLAAGALGGFAGFEPATAAAADTAYQPAAGASLYDRLGGIFAIAAVVDHFSDAVIRDPVAGARSANPQLRRWHTQQLGRLPGLKFMRTLWVAKVSGGPFDYSPTRPGATNLGLEAARGAAHLAGGVRRGRGGAGALARPFPRRRARAAGGARRLRRAQGRGHQGMARHPGAAVKARSGARNRRDDHG